jgi:hypothetical protein
VRALYKAHVCPRAHLHIRQHMVPRATGARPQLICVGLAASCVIDALSAKVTRLCDLLLSHEFGHQSVNYGMAVCISSSLSAWSSQARQLQLQAQ